MKNSIRFVKKAEHHGEYHDETVLLSTLAGRSFNSFLDISCFGISLFKRGGVLPIQTGEWVIQLQTEGTVRVDSPDGKFLLQKGDLLAVPPGVKYTYRVPKDSDMRKYFMILNSGPLPDLLIGSEIRSHGIYIRDRSEDFKKLFEEIHDAMATSGSAEKLSSLLYTLFYRLRGKIISETPTGHFQMNLRYAAGNITRQRPTLDSLSEMFGLGKYSLIRQFRKETGESPISYMIRLRLKYAEELLSLSSMSISEIAENCGYASPSFFASEFRRYYQMTPGQFRKKARKAGL